MNDPLILALDILDDPLIAALFSILQLDLPREERARPSWDEYFMGQAIFAAMRSSCPRAKVGAVLVLGRHPIAAGYNGAPAGTPTCLEAGCKVIEGHCLRPVHAEHNAIAQAAKRGASCDGAVLYCTHKPCIHCSKLLINAGIAEIVYLISYRPGDVESRFADKVLAQAGVVVRWLELTLVPLGGTGQEVGDRG